MDGLLGSHEEIDLPASARDRVARFIFGTAFFYSPLFLVLAVMYSAVPTHAPSRHRQLPF
jgi:hypothetical protein